MNLAFKLHKTHENHTKNANKIHTYQSVRPEVGFGGSMGPNQALKCSDFGCQIL